MTGTLTVRPLPLDVRVQPGGALLPLLADALELAGESLQDGDIVAVASKAVSLSEHRLVPLPAGDPHRARRELARRSADAIVADAPWVLITRTEHGFVAANGGIDTSNVPDGYALLLPEDPDASAAALRDAIADRYGRDVGVLVTDTFGRPWRTGQTDVALGAAGLVTIRDERGGRDLNGRPLEVTEAAVADELAAAADLVRGKANGALFVLLRGSGLVPGTGRGRDLVRAGPSDLFPTGGPTAAEHAIAKRRTIRRFAATPPVPDEVLERAVAAAITAPAPHGTRPWHFLDLREPTRTRLLDAMAERWHGDLADDGHDAAAIASRIARSDAVLRTAPSLLLPLVSLEGAHDYPDERRKTAERDLFVLSAGAALQNLQVVLSAHGLGCAWISSSTFCPATVRSELDLAAHLVPTGLIAIGTPAARPPQRTRLDPSGHLERR